MEKGVADEDAATVLGSAQDVQVGRGNLGEECPEESDYEQRLHAMVPRAAAVAPPPVNVPTLSKITQRGNLNDVDEEQEQFMLPSGTLDNAESQMLASWKKIAFVCFLFVFLGALFVPEGEFFDFKHSLKNHLRLDNFAVGKVLSPENKDDGKYEEEFVVGKGGAQVLFLPCKVDGYWSNFRQVVPSLYLARKFNLTYVQQDLYYKYQDKGRIGGVDGPHNVFDLIDREHLEKFVRTRTQPEFWEGLSPADSPVLENLKFAGIEYGVRCELKVNPVHLEKYFSRWLKLYSLPKSGFLQNKIRSREDQWKKLEEISFEDESSKWVMTGTPKFEGILKDYIYTAIYRERADMPEFWQSSFEMIKFAKPIVDLQQRAKALLGIGPDEPYIAVHKRVGSTYAIGGKAGQAKVSELVEAINRAKECIGRPVKTIFLSTMLPFLKKESEDLEKQFPGHRIVKLGLDELPWETLEPGLSEREKTIRRTGVEMQFWFEADGFVGTRSTMSSVIHLMRLAHRKGDACNRFSQRSWAEKASGFPVP